MSQLIKNLGVYLLRNSNSPTRNANYLLTKQRCLSTEIKKKDAHEQKEEESNTINIAGSNYFKAIVNNAIEQNAKKLDNVDLHVEKIELDRVPKLNNQFVSEASLYAKKFLANKMQKKPKMNKLTNHTSFQIKSDENAIKHQIDQLENNQKFESKEFKKEIVNLNATEKSFVNVDRESLDKSEIIIEKSIKNETVRSELVELESDVLEMSEESIKKEIKNLRPAFRPFVYNLAYFANDSPVLQKFIEMGVSIRKWDSDRTIGEFILKLDLEKNVKPYLIFLFDIGIPAANFAYIITKNPMLFKETLEDLHTRVKYLQSKKFTQEEIVRIISKAPKWLSLSVTQVDTKLGWFQREFKMNGAQVREVVSTRPKLVTLPLKIPSDVRFCLKDFICYDDQTIKTFLLTYPRLFTKDFKQIESNFIFLTQVIKLTHEQIATYPPILNCPLIRLKSRFAYLKHLNRLQFDPTQPNFVSVKAFDEPNDEVFCTNTAKTSLDDFNKFLKTV
jgi:mTERF domain-containing protein